MKQPTAGSTKPWTIMIEKPLLCLRVGPILVSIHLAYEGQTATYCVNANQLVVSPDGQLQPQTMIAASELDALQEALTLAACWIKRETKNPHSVKNRLERSLRAKRTHDLEEFV